MGYLKKKQRRGKDVKAEVWRDKQGKPRWYAQVYAGRHPTTHRPQFVSKTFLRKKDGDEWIRKQEGMKDKNIRPATSRETLAEYLDRWLDVYSGQVRDSTIYNIRKTLGKWVLNPRSGTPPIGGKQLRKLTYGDFEKLYRHMVEQGKRPRAIRYLHGTLKRALKEGVAKDGLPYNPALDARLPKENPKAEIKAADEDHADEGAAAVVLREIGALNREQATRFQAAAKDDRYSAFWHILLTTGLRPGEALALKWPYVDLAKGEVRVRATLNRLGVKGWKLTMPKTEDSERTVPLPLVTVQELRKWKKQQAEERLAAGKEWQDHGFVFTTEKGSPHSLSNLSRRHFRRVMKQAGLGEDGPEVPEKPNGQPGPKKQRQFIPTVRMYALRHTFASLLLADGVPLLVVSRLLGHKNINTTADVYGKVQPEEQQEATAHFDTIFRSA